MEWPWSGCEHPSLQCTARLISPPPPPPVPTPPPAFPSDDEALAALSSVAKDIKTVDAWHLQFELLTTIRRLALHHPDTMDKKTCSSVLVPFVTEKVRSNDRSMIVRAKRDGRGKGEGDG